MPRILIATLALIAGPVLAAPSGLAFRAIEGGEIALDDLAGRPVLVVNTASMCAFTSQLEGLQALWEAHRDEGLTVIAVPSDDFRQELGTDAEVAEFCEVNYGLTLPMAAITHVRGDEAHPFYGWVRGETGWRPRWNFGKVLLDADGEVAATFDASTRPGSRAMTRALDEVLGARAGG